MHELSIAAELITIIRSYVEEPELHKVRDVCVSVSEHGNIVTDSLVFSYDAIKGDAGLVNSQLAIAMIPVQMLCKSCDFSGSIQGMIYRCPQCESTTIQVTTPDDIKLTELILDD